MSFIRPSRRYQILARKWLNGSITHQEKQEFADWYNRGQDEPLHIHSSVATSEEEHRLRLLASIENRIDMPGPARRLPAYSLSIAAAISLLVLAAAGHWMFKNRDVPHLQVPALALAADIAPGGDKATLTLADGSELDLQKLADGQLHSEQEFSILKQQGALIYKTSHEPAHLTGRNTITTPRGGQFRVVLPDGSKVWLNASSSLEYPTRFDGDSRMVRLTGEGYFEVAKDLTTGGKPKPFLINVNDREKVEVLGTHFNIMAYTEEQVIRTTLLEGSVRVSKNNSAYSRLLRPGQQSVFSKRKGFEIRSNIDLAESVSWKNGQISFKDADIRSIMRQIARWYDVEVRYQGDIPDRLFNGGISRSSNLSGVLKILELNDIHFKVENRTITVMP